MLLLSFRNTFAVFLHEAFYQERPSQVTRPLHPAGATPKPLTMPGTLVKAPPPFPPAQCRHCLQPPSSGSRPHTHALQPPSSVALRRPHTHASAQPALLAAAAQAPVAARQWSPASMCLCSAPVVLFVCALNPSSELCSPPLHTGTLIVQPPSVVPPRPQVFLKIHAKMAARSPPAGLATAGTRAPST